MSVLYTYTHKYIQYFSLLRAAREKNPFHIYSCDCSYRIQYPHSLTGCHSKSGILFYMHTCSTFDGLFSCINTCIANSSRFKCPHITNMRAEKGRTYSTSHLCPCPTRFRQISIAVGKFVCNLNGSLMHKSEKKCRKKWRKCAKKTRWQKNVTTKRKMVSTFECIYLFVFFL